MQRCKKAVGQSNISPTLLKEFPMYKPILSEQQKFAALVEKVERLRSKQRESEKELEDLFNSLMQKAFNGELFR
jgi:type I restriction enzyme S subunit